jgi:hypothetical protein
MFYIHIKRRITYRIHDDISSCRPVINSIYRPKCCSSVQHALGISDVREEVEECGVGMNFYGVGSQFMASKCKCIRQALRRTFIFLLNKQDWKHVLFGVHGHLKGVPHTIATLT